MPLTPSQFKAARYFLVVILLFLVQTNFGGLLAHYTIHPASFWFPLVSTLIPYSWAKTWHLQLAIFWIATTWVGSAIYLAPIIGGVEPRRQSLLVRLLFGAILVVAVGSLLGEIADPSNPPSGCYFHPRCRYAQPICAEDEPALPENLHTVTHFAPDGLRIVAAEQNR